MVDRIDWSGKVAQDWRKELEKDPAPELLNLFEVGEPLKLAARMMESSGRRGRDATQS